MRDKPVRLTAALTEPSQREMFELLKRSTTLLAALGQKRDGSFAQKLDVLMVRGWRARVEFSFDGAGPLSGTLTMDSPDGSAVEVLRIEAISLTPAFRLSEPQSSSLVFDKASVITRSLLRLASSHEATGALEMDTLLNNGATCTLQFVMASTGPLSCGLLLLDTGHVPAELVRVDSPARAAPFLFETAIPSAQSDY